MTKNRQVATPDLKPGDIVLNHGMRLLVEGPAQVFPNHNNSDRDAYVWQGRCLNAAEISDRFILTHLDWQEPRVGERRGYWSIQGNDLAHWTVEA